MAAGAEIITDELPSDAGLDGAYFHNVINHAVKSVQGHVHTQVMESFWSLLKRGLSRTYMKMQPFHLFRCIDDQTFWYNNRKDKRDGDRFKIAVDQILGRRLTYAQVTRKA